MPHEPVAAPNEPFGARRWRSLRLTAVLVAVPALLVAATAAAPVETTTARSPALVGRAVLPVHTYAQGPPAGAFVTPTTINGITFPVPQQPVEGFSAIIAGRTQGEYLAMADNGFGSKANSPDFLIRAYYLSPDFMTAAGGSGGVDVTGFVSFSDPHHRIGFEIVNDGSRRRLLTGGDIDPESLQRGRNGDLWVGDEFGPWILHFDPRGRLLEAPFAIPGGVMSPSNPFLHGSPATHPNSRGFEGMAITPDRRHLYAALEGATTTDPDPSRRLIFKFSTLRGRFAGRTWAYRTEEPGHLIADMWALDRHRLVVIERDLGSGTAALFRRLYRIDLRRTDMQGFLRKTLLVDLTKVPDPDLVSLPALHAGDLGLGDPFWVMCESVEAVHALDRQRFVIGCDNNFPNSGRNPALPDDNELIVVRVAKTRSSP